MDTPPVNDNWRMPAEWTRHEATWLAWPHHRDDWPGKFSPIPWVYAEVVRHLHTGERVYLLVRSKEEKRRAQRVLHRSGVDLKRVRFFAIPTNRVWTRDYGPIFLTNSDGTIAMTDWHFNGWAKYDDWKLDNAVPEKINKRLGIPAWKPTAKGKRVVLEGGSIDVNGEGLLLATEECLLGTSQQRNPELSKKDIETVLGDYLAIDKVLWFGRGIVGDDTHGHIDDLARFVDPHTIAIVVETNPNDENYHALQENIERARDMKDQQGRRLQIVTLPMPAPVVFRNERLPASYANFYIANDCVLVPTFNDPQDRVALGVLSEVFPDRMVTGIHAVDLVWGLGTLHCMTQQQPMSNQQPIQT
ncbi:MAG: agmatine/peptidylarginine deiminase [Gemmataceae bacterium]